MAAGSLELFNAVIIDTQSSCEALLAKRRTARLAYSAIVDSGAVSRWMVAHVMSSHVPAFDPREGGAFRVSLNYNEPTEIGKTTAHADTYHDRFVPNARVVEVMEFETEDSAMQESNGLRTWLLYATQ